MRENEFEVNLLKISRTSLWWNAIVPQVLGWLYFSLLVTNNLVEKFTGCSVKDVFSMENLLTVTLFFIALIGISSFGYLFNDWCDVESDFIAGKKNSLAGYSNFAQTLIVGISFSLGLSAWVLLQSKSGHSIFHISNILFVTQILLLVTYSLPPFRLKERAEFGVLADAAYGHLNPIFITLTLFLPLEFRTWNIFFFPVLFVVCCVKGLRNILLHQIEDRKSDKLASIHSAPVKFGPLSVIDFVNKILLPLEILFLVALVLLISVQFPPFIVSFLLFAIFSYFNFSGWKVSYLPKRQLKFKFLHFLNDYYEGWMPVFFLIILSVSQREYLLVLILHLILFPAFILKLINGFKTIKENFKTEEDY